MQEASPNTYVLWIYASSAARFELSIRDLLEQLNVPGWSKPKANVFQLFRNWLREKKPGRWLIVLDNADDTAFLVEPPCTARQSQDESQLPQSGERCIDYLPACSHGSMLATSRSSDAALNFVAQKDIVKIGPMDDVHAVALIEKKLEGQYKQEETAELARALDFMPLAIAQAPAYIRQSASRCSIQQ